MQDFLKYDTIPIDAIVERCVTLINFMQFKDLKIKRLIFFIEGTSTICGISGDLAREPEKSFRMTDRKTRYVTVCDISIVVAIGIFSALTLHLMMKKFLKMMHLMNQVGFNF